MQTRLFYFSKHALVIVLMPFSLGLFSCTSGQRGNETPPPATISDTLIVKQKITDELAGSVYRKRATCYFLVVKGDTSVYRPVFMESRTEGRVSLVLDFYSTLTYEEHLAQLRVLLPDAAQDYNFDSLGTVYMGRLVEMGSLAVDLTNEYLTVFGGYGSSATTAYPEIAEFMTQSRLGRDMDELFRPYDLHVSGASVEKVFFTPLKASSAIHAERYHQTNIPDRLLDASTWFYLKKSENP